MSRRNIAGMLPGMAPTSYAVIWQNGDGTRRSGRVELRTDRLRLEGFDEAVAVPYADLTGISMTTTATDRLAGRPTLVLARKDAQPVRLASVAQIGIVSELAERLTALQLDASERSNGSHVPKRPRAA